VVGTSGSGKSSLVRAGLLPALFGGTMVSVGSRWEVGVFRPGGDPIRNLAQSLIDCDLYDGDDPETLPRLMATLRRSRNGLVEAIRQSDLGERHNFLLVVDQFEELFRFSADRPEHQELASEFAQLLLRAASSPEIPIYITLTMRSDYLGECAQLPGLAEAVNHGEYLIPRLTRDQRRDAIERPVAVGGGKISRRLINQLLNEVGDDVDQLPVLQHALMRIWDCWEEDHQNDEPIDLRHYEAVGGLTRALSQHADEVFEELGDRHAQLLCERIFKGLTERGSDERGIRRPTPMATLCKIVEGQAEDVRRVLDAFRKVGRTFVMPLEETAIDESTIIDISHESLMRVWGRLRNWVDEESQSARVYRRLAETASLFHDQRAGHYRDPDLSIAWAWREQNSPNRDWADRYAPGFEAAIEFLDESQKVATAEERERELRRQRELEQAQRLAEAQLKARRRSQGLTACAMVAAIVIGFFWNSASDARREAEKARGQAEKQRDVAESAAEKERLAKEAEAIQRGIAERESQQNRLGLYA
ncbi:MAG: GTPase domain-containing protein, partial [Planctomycetota bacterium]|nr:GTPase domain-containing protein [Planctomycetota bacterium]